MSGWRIGRDPPAAMLAWAERTPAFFAHPLFARALSVLGGECLYAWNEARSAGVLVPIFRRLRWLRLGFLGFPVCPPGLETATLAERLLAEGHCQVLRIVLPMLPQPASAADGLRPDVWIEALPAWSPSPRLRRDLAYARRHLSSWRLIEDRLDARAAASLYESVIARHRGRAVYDRGYFAALAAALGATPGLSAYALEDESGRPRAFAVLAIHAGTGYYLHAAADAEARRRGAGDRLLHAVVERARALGCLRLDLMASPPSQPGLLAFKRKWGDRIGGCATSHASRGPLGWAMAQALAWRLRRDGPQR